MGLVVAFIGAGSGDKIGSIVQAARGNGVRLSGQSAGWKAIVH